MSPPEHEPSLSHSRPIRSDDLRSIDLNTLPNAAAEPILTWTVSSGPVAGLAIDDVIGVVATGSDRGLVGVFDLVTGEGRARFLTDGWVWSLTFSPDHRLLTAVGLDGSMWCWNWTRHERIVDGVIPGIQAQNGRPWLSDCGRRMAMMKSDGLMIWDVQGFARTCLIRPPGSMGEAVAFDEKAERVFFATGVGGTGKMVPGDMTRKVNGALHILSADDVAAVPAADASVTAGGAQRNQMWRVDNARPVELPASIADLAINLVSIVGDRHLVVSRGRVLESFDLVNGARIGPSIELPEFPRRIDTRGELVAVLGQGWLVVNWRTGELVAGRRAPKPPSRPPSRPPGQPAGRPSSAPRARGGKRPRPKPPAPVRPQPMRVRLSRSGSHVVVSSSPGLVELFDVESCRAVSS